MATPVDNNTTSPTQWSPPPTQNVPIIAEAAATYIPPIVSAPPGVPVITSEDNIKLIDVLTNIQVALENIATILDKNTIPNVKTTKSKTKE